MAKKKPKSARRKRRTREHVIADLSVNFVERQALLCGYSVERVRYDYGLDLLVITYNNEGEVEEGELLFQVKATNKPKISKDGQRLSFRVETEDLHYWLSQKMPMILVVFDAVKEEAYWLYVQAYFQQKNLAPDLSKGKLTVHIPLANKLDPAAFRKFAQFKDRVSQQLQEIEHHE